MYDSMSRPKLFDKKGTLPIAVWLFGFLNRRKASAASNKTRFVSSGYGLLNLAQAAKYPSAVERSTHATCSHDMPSRKKCQGSYWYSSIVIICARTSPMRTRRNEISSGTLPVSNERNERRWYSVKAVCSVSEQGP